MQIYSGHSSRDVRDLKYPKITGFGTNTLFHFVLSILYHLKGFDYEYNNPVVKEV